MSRLTFGYCGRGLTRLWHALFFGYDAALSQDERKWFIAMEYATHESVIIDVVLGNSIE